MKINSINNINNNYNNQSFKRTAVPYPEFTRSYSTQVKDDSIVSSLMNKISKLFQPDVTKEAVVIKSQIDKIYDPKTLSPKEHLLSVLA